MQFDYKQHPYGSRRAHIAHHATLASAGARARRAVVIVPLAEARLPLVTRLLSNVTNAAGMVVVLPANDFDEGSAGTPQARELERYLMTSTRVPVYFARETDGLTRVQQDLKSWIAQGNAPTSVSGGWHAVVGKGEPRKIKPPPSLTNFQGLLHGGVPPSTSEESSAAGGVILVVASYDAFGAAQALAQGSISAAAALVELARLFQKLYAEHSHKPSTSIAFVLAAGGHLNFVGSRAWLASADTKLLNAVSFALCLDNLLIDPLSAADDEGPGKLFLHSARPPDDASVEPLYTRFKAAGELSDVSVSTVHKRVNVSAPTAAWEHELFSRRRMAAATLSARSTPPPFLSRASIFDRGEASANATALAGVVRTVAEALARHVLAVDGVKVSATESLVGDVSIPNLTHWMKMLGRVPRVAPFASLAESRATKAMEKVKSAVDRNAKLAAEAAAAAESNHSGVQPALSKAMRDYTSEAKSMDFELPRDWSFYTHAEELELRLYRTASVGFDVALLAGVLAYLGALYVALKAYTYGWSGVVEALSGDKRRPSAAAKGGKRR